MPALTLIGCVYQVLALLYWFRAPAIGVASWHRLLRRRMGSVAYADSVASPLIVVSASTIT